MQVTKAPKTSARTSAHAPPRSVRDVLHLEIVMQRVLAALPLADLRSFLSAVGGRADLRWLLQDAALWEELLALHFKGRRHVSAEDEEEDGTSASESDDDEEEDSEAEEEDEDVDAGDDEGDADANTSEHAPTTSATSSESVLPVAENPPTELATASSEQELPLAAMATELFAEVPKWLEFDHICTEAKEFVASMYEWLQFQQRVMVVRGDIRTIENLDETPIDAIAFPGNQAILNPYSGAATAVFARAGPDLESHTRHLGVHLRSGQSYVTPGFDSGVRVLIHCHGPHMAHPRLFPTLAKTYKSALRHAQQGNVQCLAMASISTGNFGVPVSEASRTGLKAIQHYLRSHHEWQGRLGIVCFEHHVFEAFHEEFQHILSAFNASEDE